MDIILLTAVSCSFIFAIVGMVFAILAYTETQSFKKSTHSVQYVGAKPQDIGISDTPEGPNPLDTLNKEYSEEIEQEMPWASSSDEDKTLRSF